MPIGNSGARKRIAIIGAGAKAAAIACKAAALARLPEYEPRVPDIWILERYEEAWNWGADQAAPGPGRELRYTDGSSRLVTSPLKDVGFPYRSEQFGERVVEIMRQFSWPAYMLSFDAPSGGYARWIDQGGEQPTLSVWRRYLQWALKTAKGFGGAGATGSASMRPRIELVPDATVRRLNVEGGKISLDGAGLHTVVDDGETPLQFDGVVETGPGPARTLASDGDRNPAYIAPDASDWVFDARDYWNRMALFYGLPIVPGKPKALRVAVIGRGEAAAAVIQSILTRSRLDSMKCDVRVCIVNPSGVLYTRGTSVFETQYFNDPSPSPVRGPVGGAAGWADLPESDRLEILSRADRGVFNAAVMTEITRDDRVEQIAGRVSDIRRHGSRLRVTITSKRPGVPPRFEHFDRVVSALGFDHYRVLELHGIRPTELAADAPEQKRLEAWGKREREIDDQLRLDLETSRGANIHVPMIAGLKNGPGFPTLQCLGLLSDRILSAYVTKVSVADVPGPSESC